MTATSRSSRPTLADLPIPPLFAAMIFLLGGAPGWATTPVTQASPAPLASVASAAPAIQPTQAEPLKLVRQAPAPGSKEPPVARGEGKVAAGRPVTFEYLAETKGLYSIGVSSPKGSVYLTVHLDGSTRPETGTADADRAIRWSTHLNAGTMVKIVVNTAGPETPFRVEAIGGPGSL